MSNDHLSNPVTALAALRTVKYPATREQLLDHARRAGADEMTMAAIGQLPDGPFHAANELTPLLGPLPASGAGSGPRGLWDGGDDTADHPAMVNPPDTSA
jgi:hypothetical protein